MLFDPLVRLFFVREIFAFHNFGNKRIHNFVFSGSCIYFTVTGCNLPWWWLTFDAVSLTFL